MALHKVAYDDENDPYYAEYCSVVNDLLEEIYRRDAPDHVRVQSLCHFLGHAVEFIFMRNDADYSWAVLSDLGELLSELRVLNQPGLEDLVYGWVASISGNTWGEVRMGEIGVILLDHIPDAPILEHHRAWVRRWSSLAGAEWLAEDILEQNPDFFEDT